MEPLKFQDNTLLAFQNYKALCEKQSDYQLKILYIDRKEKYMGEFDDYFQENGIIHKITAPYSNKQNEKTKRVYHIIMNAVWAIFTQQKLLKLL